MLARIFVWKEPNYRGLNAGENLVRGNLESEVATCNRFSWRGLHHTFRESLRTRQGGAHRFHLERKLFKVGTVQAALEFNRSSKLKFPGYQ